MTSLLYSIFLTLFVTFMLRLMYLLYQIYFTPNKLKKQGCSLRTIFCVGSGGHTAELLRIKKFLDPKKYEPRLYILADNDVSSEVRIKAAEANEKNYELKRIPRSRNVKQSYVSAVFSTLYSTLYTIPVVANYKPDVIICNGPGTCIPVCVVAFILRCLFLLDCRIVFVESICRVRTLSLTGKILQYCADIIVIQWPQLRDICFRAKYLGRLT